MLIDSPVVHLFMEHIFFVFIVEFWEDLPVISEVIDECLEGFSITVDKDFIIDFFQSVHF